MAIGKIQFNSRIIYAGDLIVQSLSILLFMWIFMQLWQSTFRSSNQEVLYGMTLRETMWYLMLAETIMLSKPRLSRTISETVKDGSIAYLINKPYYFLFYQLSVALGDLASRVFFNLLIGGAIVWIMVGPPPDPRGWPLVVLTFTLCWVIDYCLNVTIGLAAFITEEVAAFEWIYSKFLLLLGGVLIPLDFFPAWLQKLAFALPFAFTVYGPARLFVDPSLSRFFWLLSRQAIWASVFGILLYLLYRKCVMRLVINGG